jgi:hypothetical protein
MNRKLSCAGTRENLQEMDLGAYLSFMARLFHLPGDATTVLRQRHDYLAGVASCVVDHLLAVTALRETSHAREARCTRVPAGRCTCCRPAGSAGSSCRHHPRRPR